MRDHELQADVGDADGDELFQPLADLANTTFEIVGYLRAIGWRQFDRQTTGQLDLVGVATGFLGLGANVGLSSR